MFQEWLKKKRLKEGLADGRDPVAGFKFNQDADDFAEDQDRAEADLFKTVMRKYPEETMDFLQTISQRGDTEISALLRKIDKNRGPRLSKNPEHPSSGDEVVPSLADSGFSSGSNED
jgi:hypothetical protein